MGLKQSKQPANFFCKTLTASDTSTHGGFSVPRRKDLPTSGFLNAASSSGVGCYRFLHHQSWTFRNIYRGQPKRHLLTTGWSIFVSSKRLFAGDAVLFVRDEKSQLLLGVRRVNRQQSSLSSSVISSDSMHIGILATAAHAAANNSLFTVYYNPRASPAEFVIPLAKYNKAMYSEVSVGMRFRMMFETQESGVHRYMGTITSISDLDPARWKNSQWRSIQVGWDESAANERPSRVSIWDIEPIVTPFYMYPSPFFRPKLHQQSGVVDTEIERGMPMPWLEDICIKDGLSLVQWMSLQTQPINLFSNSLGFEDPSKLLSFQFPSPSHSNKPNQLQHLSPHHQYLHPTSVNQQHQLQQQQQLHHQHQQSVYNQLQQQKPESQQISGSSQPQQQITISSSANRTSFQPLSVSQHPMEQQRQQTQLQRATAHLLQHNLTLRQHPLSEQQQTLQILQQQHLFSPIEPLQQQVLPQIYQLKQVSDNSLSTSTLVQNQQKNQYKPLRVHPPTDVDIPSCSTSPSTNNCQLTSSNFRITNQQGPSVLVHDSMVHDAYKILQSQSKSDARVRYESCNLKQPEQPNDKTIATEPTASVTSDCLDDYGGTLPNNFSIPNLCLEGDGISTHSQTRRHVYIDLMLCCPGA